MKKIRARVVSGSKKGIRKKPLKEAGTVASYGIKVTYMPQANGTDKSVSLQLKV